MVLHYSEITAITVICDIDMHECYLENVYTYMIHKSH